MQGVKRLIRNSENTLAKIIGKAYFTKIFRLKKTADKMTSPITSDRSFRMMQENSIAYDIKRVTGLFSSNNATLAGYIKTKRAFCLIDSNLNSYRQKIADYFESFQIEPKCNSKINLKKSPKSART